MAAALLLSACGGGGADGRPSVSEVAEALNEDAAESGVTEEQTECTAKILVDSDVSDEGLRAMIEQDETFEPSDEDAAALMAAILKATEECELVATP